MNKEEVVFPYFAQRVIDPRPSLADRPFEQYTWVDLPIRHGFYCIHA